MTKTRPSDLMPLPSPMMQHYDDIKAKLEPGTILLLKLGDFYEVFGDDARTVAKALEITLTSRRGIPMAGIPYHCAERWTAKLVEAGHKVALAEYSPKPAFGA